MASTSRIVTIEALKMDVFIIDELIVFMVPVVVCKLFIFAVDTFRT
jgi:hypothetical protein